MPFDDANALPSPAAPLPDELRDHFMYLYALALSDLHLDPSELAALYDIGTRRGVERERIDGLLLNPNQAAPTVPEDVQTRVGYLYDFALMIQADGMVDESESRMLARLCGVFKFEEKNVDDIVSFLLERAAQAAPVDAVLAEAAAAM